MSDDLEEVKNKGGRPRKSAKPDNSPEAVKKAQDEHETMKWFDVFEAVPQMVNFQDFDSNESKSVITGFELVKKLNPVFIEPYLANGQGAEPGFNHHAFWSSRGYGGGNQKAYLERDKYKTGDVVKWEDIAVLLSLPNGHPNTRNLKKYKETV